MGISLHQAGAVISAARKVAAELGEVVSLAVVEAGGELVAFTRMDGAASYTAELAKRKADIAVALGFDTVHMTTAASQGQPIVGGPRQSGTHSLVPNGGGVIIRVGGAIIGALGVSGAASSITDHKIGTAAVAQVD
ncbi:heme-binding protein [Nocardia sp. NPDC004654]|uniref:GlcG/HbpS family heme-binding protein n=1 Tax=Nocardia sp. NPDC004654 TaxID=3154776 RepID=UPI0033B7F2AD